MSEPIISVENLSKRYWIGHQSAQRERYTALRDVIMREGRNFARKAVDLVRGKQVVQGDEVEEFWALKDVSFDVKEGEILGVIGRNGAGKSTLLKILSRITEPTEGRVVIRGRVSSLLEVGTGFHPELTGRENIYLNGAILGMAQREIRKKFDEIVAFAEVEKFLDTPAKRYSSGMYVRLAFAIAAHLEPEVLVVDEVLAVGDTEFQKKCLGKMDEVSRRQGRTVLFVSHDMDAIERLTSRCVLLGNGRIVRDGPTKSVVTEYLRSSQTLEIDLSRYRTSSIPDTVSLQKIWVKTADSHGGNTVRQGEPFRIMVQIEVENVSACELAVVIENERQNALFATHLTDLGRPITAKGNHVFAIELTKPNLRSGQYLISFGALSTDRKMFYDFVLHIPVFQISGIFDKSFPTDERPGDFYVPIKWSLGGTAT